MERLQKILSRAGVASRRGAEKLMGEGRVAEFTAAGNMFGGLGGMAGMLLGGGGGNNNPTGSVSISGSGFDGTIVPDMDLNVLLITYSRSPSQYASVATSVPSSRSKAACATSTTFRDPRWAPFS